MNCGLVTFLQDMVPWRMFWKITFQLTLKIWNLNSDVNDSFLLSYIKEVALYVYTYFRFWDSSS